MLNLLLVPWLHHPKIWYALNRNGGKFNHLRDTFGAGLVHINLVTVVLVGCMANVPAIDAV